jgi:tripartite-type tricarboxylate transporter receptor subunit TctC
MKNHSVRLAMLFAFACIGTAFAQSYPNHPIRVIIPWPPGQATDLAARMVSEKLVPVLGQPLVMDNKPGSGASSHLASVLFNSMANVDAVHVPYKGSSPSVTDLVSGQVAYTIETVPSIVSFVKSGRLRALAVSTAKRSAAMPEIGTIADDLPGYEMSGWIGFMSPAGMPNELRARLSAETRKVLQDPDIRSRFIALGLDPAGNTPEEYAEFLKRQNDRYASIVKQAGLKLD